MTDKNKDESFADDLKSGMSDFSERLSTLSDRMKLKLHLGSMEAKKAFEKLEPALKKIDTDMRQASDELNVSAGKAEVQAHLAFMEAREKWDTIKDHVSHVVNDVKGDAKSKAATSVDEAKLKAHLAGMDAEDAAEERATRIRKKLDSAADTVKKETRLGIKAIRDSFDDLLKALD